MYTGPHTDEVTSVSVVTSSSYREQHLSLIITIKLQISEISSSHGGEYDVQSCLLGCTAV
jgi:hypothetical protein